MANKPAVNQAKTKIADIMLDADLAWKLAALKDLRKLLNTNIAVVETAIKANPPSATNVPTEYILCDLSGKPFAKFSDGAIVSL